MKMIQLTLFDNDDPAPTRWARHDVRNGDASEALLRSCLRQASTPMVPGATQATMLAWILVPGD
jgi:hypothetical protein